MITMLIQSPSTQSRALSSTPPYLLLHPSVDDRHAEGLVEEVAKVPGDPQVKVGTDAIGLPLHFKREREHDSRATSQRKYHLGEVV